MLIKEMPFYNRPSYKLVEKGSAYLDEAELLAIIINSGNKKENAIDLSNRLLKKYNLQGLGNESSIIILEIGNFINYFLILNTDR